MCRLAETCYTFKEHHRSTTCRLAEKCYTFYQHYRSIMCRLAEKYYTFTNTTGAYTLPALQEHHVQTGREVLHLYHHYRSIHFTSTTGAPCTDWQRSVTPLPPLQEHTLYQHYRSTMCRLEEKCHTLTLLEKHPVIRGEEEEEEEVGKEKRQRRRRSGSR